MSSSHFAKKAATILTKSEDTLDCIGLGLYSFKLSLQKLLISILILPAAIRL